MWHCARVLGVSPQRYTIYLSANSIPVILVWYSLMVKLSGDFQLPFRRSGLSHQFLCCGGCQVSQIDISTLSTLTSNVSDTPRWYYARGRDAEGDSVLERLHGFSMAQVEEDKREISASLELEHSEKAGLRLKDFFWDTSDMQSARRIRTSMIVYALTYLSG